MDLPRRSDERPSKHFQRTDPEVLDRPIEMSVEYIEDATTLRRAEPYG